MPRAQLVADFAEILSHERSTSVRPRDKALFFQCLQLIAIAAEKARATL